MDLITTHPSADFDGVASMVAARHLYPGAVLAFSGSAEEKVRAFVDGGPVSILNPGQVDMDAVTRVILCDTHAPERAGHFSELCRKVPLHAFDHHPVEEGEFQLQQAVIEPAGATATLMAYRLKAAGVTLSPWEATLMVLGIYEETGCLTFASTTPRDLDAARLFLEQGADLTTVRRTLTSELSLEQLELLDTLAHQVEVRYLDGYKTGIATAHTERYVADAAVLANRLLAMEPMDALVVLIGMEEKVLLVARGARPEIPLGEVARVFGGGGHPTAASAMVHDQTPQQLADAVWAELERRIIPLVRVSAIMSTRPVTVNTAHTMKEVEAVLTRYGINAVPVMEGERLAGVLTRETVQKAIAHRMRSLPAGEVMDSEPFTVTPDTPLREARERMVESNQRFTPVLDGNRLVGCLTRTDLLRAMHDDLRPEPRPLGSAPTRARGVDHLMRRHLPPAVYQLLREAGAEGETAGIGIYMAGGIVRDLLLGKENLDVDLVVEGDAIPFARNWATRCSGARVHTHERFGTATLTLEREGLPPHFKIDLASARTEFYDHPSALPQVEHSSLKKDLYRRDFTINALAVALNGGPEGLNGGKRGLEGRFGTLIDYFGGQRDLKDRRIRVLHTLSLIEDPTRALRAVRFATRLGFSLGRQTEHLIRGAAKLDLYKKLSGKRVLTELQLLFADHNPVAAVLELERLGVLPGIDPDLAADSDLRERLERARDAVGWYRLQFPGRPLAAWQVWLLALGDAAEPERRDALWQRLSVPGRLRGLWQRWADLPHLACKALPGTAEADPLAVYRCLHGAPDEVLVHLMAIAQSSAVEGAVSLYLSRLKEIRPVVTGSDLKGMGIPEGPLYREILEQLLWARIEGRVEGKSEELDWVRRRGYGCV
ncbi:MAG: CBS domain-containing protein [Nitrospirota bacterium]|nr:CBS domain-containing protein [Nitrospirota bacterium]